MNDHLKSQAENDNRPSVKLWKATQPQSPPPAAGLEALIKALEWTSKSHADASPQDFLAHTCSGDYSLTVWHSGDASWWEPGNTQHGHHCNTREDAERAANEHWRKAIAPALTASAAPSGGVVEAATALVAQVHAKRFVVHPDIADSAKVLSAALSSAPAAQQESPVADMWWDYDNSETQLEHPADYLNDNGPLPIGETFELMAAQSLPDEYYTVIAGEDDDSQDVRPATPEEVAAYKAKHTKPTPPPASQDAAGEGVRWFSAAGNSRAGYWECRGGKCVWFNPENRCGDSSSEASVCEMEENVNRGSRREISRADVDAIRASWKPPSPEGVSRG